MKLYIKFLWWLGGFFSKITYGLAKFTDSISSQAFKLQEQLDKRSPDAL